MFTSYACFNWKATSLSEIYWWHFNACNNSYPTFILGHIQHSGLMYIPVSFQSSFLCMDERRVMILLYEQCQGWVNSSSSKTPVCSSRSCSYCSVIILQTPAKVNRLSESRHMSFASTSWSSVLLCCLFKKKQLWLRCCDLSRTAELSAVWLL